MLASAATILLILFFQINQCHAEKILFGHGPQSLTHFRSILPLAKRLSERGHEVTIWHTYADSLKQVNKSGLVNVVPIHREPPSNSKAVFTSNIWKDNYHGFMLVVPNIIFGKVSPTYLESHTAEVVDLLNTDWDLVISTLLFNVHTRAFVEILARERGIPHAIMATFSILPSYASKLSMGRPLAALPTNLGTRPHCFDDSFDLTNPVIRIGNALEQVGDYISTFLTERVYYPDMIRRIGADGFDIDRFMTEASLALTDMPEFMNFPSPQVTRMRSTGAYCDKSAKVPSEFRTFMEDPKSKGTIYIAFGTVVAWDYAPDIAKQIIFDALDTLTDYRIIFAFKGRPPKRKIPSHIRLVEWAPQLDILSHPTTQIFVTHGGLKSIKEGICTATPMLVLPLFAEQGRNAQLLMRLGLGGSLNKHTLSPETILDGLRRMLDNAETYTARARKLRSMYLDRPIDELDDGAFYVERLFRVRNKLKSVNATNNLSLIAKNSTKAQTTANKPTYSSRSDGTELFFRSHGAEITIIDFLFGDLLIVLFIAILLLTKN